MISYALDLNLIPGGVLPRIDLSQYDHGQSVECDLYNGAVPYTIPSGSVAYVEGTKPDKTGFQYEANIATNKVTFEVTQQMTACGGEVVTELVITHSGDRIATINFILNVEPAALAEDTIISETDLPIVQQIPEYVEQIGEYAEEAEAWATGGEGGTPSATNNSKYWAEKSQQYAIGAFHWKAKVAFANLPTTNLTVGDVYEVSDAFNTDSRFSEGAGVQCEAGTEIVWTDGGKWSILTPPGVTSFNGRKGAVSPASGDYSASQISSSAITGQTNVEGALSTLNAKLNDKMSYSDADDYAIGLAKGEFYEIGSALAQYFSDALVGGQDTITLSFVRGSNRFVLSFGRNGISYQINGTTIWSK